jgi:hypothetical protein
MTTATEHITGDQDAPEASPDERRSNPAAAWREPLAALVIVAALIATIWLDPTSAGLANLAAVRTVAALVALVLLGPTLIFIPGRILVAVGLVSAAGLILLVRYQDALLPAQAMVGGIQLLTGAAFLLACAAVAARRPALLLAGAFAACGVVAAELAWTVLSDGLGTERLAGLLGYRNASAGAVAAFAVGIVPAWASERAWVRTAGAIGAAVAGLAMAATLSRGALAAMFVGMLLVVWLWRRSDALGQRARAAAGLIATAMTLVAVMTAADSRLAAGVIALIAAAVAVAVIPRSWEPVGRIGEWISRTTWSSTTKKRWTVAVLAVAALGLAIGGGPRALDQFRSTEVSSTTSTDRLLKVGSNQRWQWWTEAADEWKTAPILGHGTGAFSLRRQSDPDTYRPAQRAHSAPLQSLVELGVLGTALLIAAGVLLMTGFARARVASTALVGTLAGAGVAAAASLGVQGATDWTLSAPFLTTLFVLLLATASNIAPAALAEPRDPRSGTAWLILSPAVLLPLAIAPAWAYWHLEQGEKNMAAAFVRLDKGDTKGATALLIKAEKDGAATWRILPEPRALDLRVNALLTQDQAKSADKLLKASMPLVINDRGSWQLEYDMALLFNDQARAEEALAQYRA